MPNVRNADTVLKLEWLIRLYNSNTCCVQRQCYGNGIIVDNGQLEEL